MIRNYTKNDIKDIVALEEKTLGTSLGENMLNMELDNPLAHYFVYYDQSLEGYISTSFDGEVVEILNICVEPIYQHKGIGSKLMNYILGYFYSRNAKSVFLEVRNTNINAISFYLKYGFKKAHIRKGYYSNGNDAIVMIKELVPVIELEDKYLECYAKIERFDNYQKVSNDYLYDKFYSNYYVIDDISMVEELSKNHKGSYIHFKSYKPLALEGYEVCHNGFYYASIHNINGLKKNVCDVELLSKDNAQEFEEFLFDDCKAYGEDYARRNAKYQIDTALSGKVLYFFVRKEGKIVGSAHAFMYKGFGEIEDFAILDDYQHQGYGTALFMGIIDFLKKHEVYDIVLTVDEDDTVKNMYMKMGFIYCFDYYLYRK